MRTSSAIALFLAVTVAVGGFLLFAPSTAAQDDEGDDVPVPFTPSSAQRAPLYFWVTDYGSGDCQPEPQTSETIEIDTPFCSARTDAPGDASSTDQAEQESYNVRQNEEAERDAAQFVLDTQAIDPNTVSAGDDIRGKGLEFPIKIRGTNAIKYDFHYDANQACIDDGSIGTPLDFTMRLVRADAPKEPGDAIENPQVIERTQTTVRACGHDGTIQSSSGSERVSVGVDLDTPVEVAAGETLVAEIFADAASDTSQPLEWAIFFEHEDFPSKVELRTNQVLERAIWAADDTGTHKTVFDPEASPSDRYMVGHVAIRSAFGAGILQNLDLRGSVENPDGVGMNLHPDHENEQALSVAYQPVSGLSSHNGSQQEYRFGEIGGEQVWNYDPDQENFDVGPHTITASGTTQVADLEPTLDFGTTVALGDFPFTLDTIEQDASLHEMVPDSSTTFLLELTNEGPAQETFELSPEFRFSEGGAAWSVDLQGVDANDRVTLEGGESALIRVTLTPPSQATVGDAARIGVDAESLSSDTVETKTLEASLTDTVTRDVELLILREEPYTVGVDRTTQIDVFMWNKGTAPDTLRASFVDDTFDPDDPGVFTTSFPQRSFEGVTPGDLARLPIDVTTTDQVDSGQELSFDVEASSTNQEGVTDQDTVTAVVEAIREFSVTGLVGDNDRVTTSERFGKFNISEEGSGITGGSCEDNVPDDASEDEQNQYERNCRDYSNHTYHLFEIENQGDLTETFELSHFGESWTSSDPSSCTEILPGRMDALEDMGNAEFVEEMDIEDPGSEPSIDSVDVAAGQTERVFLRVSYDGQTPVSADTSSPCTWESYTTTVRVGMQGTDLATRSEAETRVYAAHPNEGDMQEEAVARLALLDRVEQDDGNITELPTFNPVEPGNTSVIPFSVSLQAGHYDPARLAIEEGATELREEGWEIELVPIDATATRVDDGEVLLFPASVPYDAPNDGPEEFHHITGAHLVAGLEVTPPQEGLQEGQQETLILGAESSQAGAEVRDSMSIGLQVGSEFGFSLDPGVTELTAEQGGEVAFALGIQNTGASVDDYTVEAIASPGTYDDPTVRPTSLTIGPGSQKTASVHLDVPAGADAPAAIDVTVRADAGDATQEPILEETVEYTVDVESLGTLELEGPDQEAAIGPGGQAALSFNVTNNGETREIEMSELVAPAGFETTLSDGNETITVEAGDTEPFTLLVEAPEDVLEGSVYPFTIQAHDVDDEADFATAVGHAGVTGEVSLNLVAEQEETVIERGSNATLPVRIENPGTAPADYVVSVDFTSSGWTSTVRDSDGNALTGGTIEVVERSFERVFVEVRAPDDVPEGHTEAVHVTASALGDQDVSRTVTLNANVHDHAVSIVTEGAQTKDGVPGENVAYTVTITNEGNGPDRFELSFEGPERTEAPWTTTSVLEDDLTPELEPGERLENVTVIVQTPRAEERPVPVDGEVTVIRATSQADTPGGAPTDTAQVTTNLVRYQSIDVNDDGVLEVAVDLNRDTSDGYEVYHDPTPALIERGELEEDEAERTEGVHALDGDGDDRTEHIVDTSDDGIGDAYFDPDRSQKNTIPYTADMDGDDQPDYPLDSEFDGRLDAVYLAASGDVHAAEEVDLTGDGHFNLLADTDGDTYYDTFVDPQETPPLVTDVARDGDTYKVDTTGDGNVDTHYDAQTQSVSDARAANLGDFLASYWWFVLVFLAVLVAFGLIVYRQV